MWQKNELQTARMWDRKLKFFLMKYHSQNLSKFCEVCFDTYMLNWKLWDILVPLPFFLDEDEFCFCDDSASVYSQTSTTGQRPRHPRLVRGQAHLRTTQLCSRVAGCKGHTCSWSSSASSGSSAAALNGLQSCLASVQSWVLKLTQQNLLAILEWSLTEIQLPLTHICNL